MKILLLSHNNYSGAGKVTARINKALKQKKIISDHIYLVGKKLSLFEIFKKTLNRIICRFEERRTFSTKSPSIFPSCLSKKINKSKYEIINLTWINDFLSIEDIGKITKPIVWTLCDMWPFVGVNHYDNFSKNSMWQKQNFFKRRIGKFNLDRWLISRKINSWKNIKMHLVVPTKWMYECVKKSKIMHQYSVTLIPWPVNKDTFKNLNKIKQKKDLKLSLKKRYILFSCMNGLDDRRKGGDLLLEAIKRTKNKYEVIVLGGENKGIEKISSKVSLNWMGKIQNDKVLCKIYNSVELVAIPSRVDNLPQVGLEAQACGTPLVVFAANGLNDLVDHKQNGYLAKPFNSKYFAEGIDWTLNSQKKKNRLKYFSLKKFKKNWDSRIVANKYKNLYDKILQKNN